MPVVTLVSAKGSPGVTTAAAALTAAASLQGRALLVELDPSGGDVQVLTGVVDEPGVVLAAGELRRDVSAGAIVGHVTTAPPEVPVLMAPTASLMAASVIGSVIDRWRPALHDHGGTVFVDAGRWEASQPTARRAAIGDLIAVVCRPSLASVEHARQMVDRLREAARRPVVALVIGQKPYSPAEVAAQLEVPLGGAVAWDQRGVATLWSKGVVRSWGRTWLASTAADSVASLLALVPEAVVPERSVPRPVDTGATPAVAAAPAAGPPLGRPVGTAAGAAGTAPPASRPSPPGTANGGSAPSGRPSGGSGRIPSLPGDGPRARSGDAPAAAPSPAGPGKATLVDGVAAPAPVVRQAVTGESPAMRPGEAPHVGDPMPPVARPGGVRTAPAPTPARSAASAAPARRAPAPASTARPVDAAPAVPAGHARPPAAPSPAAAVAPAGTHAAPATSPAGRAAAPARGTEARADQVDARPDGVVAAGPGAAPAGGGYVPATAPGAGRARPTVVWAGQVPEDRPGLDAGVPGEVAEGTEDGDLGRRGDTGPIGAVAPEPTTRLGRAKQRRARRGDVPPPPPFDWAEGDPGAPADSADSGDHGNPEPGRTDRSPRRSAVPPYGPPPPPAPLDAPANAPGARRARQDDRAGGR